MKQNRYLNLILLFGGVALLIFLGVGSLLNLNNSSSSQSKSDYANPGHQHLDHGSVNTNLSGANHSGFGSSNFSGTHNVETKPSNPLFGIFQNAYQGFQGLFAGDANKQASSGGSIGAGGGDSGSGAGGGSGGSSLGAGGGGASTSGGGSNSANNNAGGGSSSGSSGTSGSGPSDGSGKTPNDGSTEVPGDGVAGGGDPVVPEESPIDKESDIALDTFGNNSQVSVPFPKGLVYSELDLDDSVAAVSGVDTAQGINLSMLAKAGNYGPNDVPAFLKDYGEFIPGYKTSYTSEISKVSPQRGPATAGSGLDAPYVWSVQDGSNTVTVALVQRQDGKGTYLAVLAGPTLHFDGNEDEYDAIYSQIKIK